MGAGARGRTRSRADCGRAGVVGAPGAGARIASCPAAAWLQGGLPATWPAGAEGCPGAGRGRPGSVTPPGTTAALAATYAKQIGRVVGFSLAAFRQAFAGGHDLSQASTVLLAGAASEIHPRALLQAISRPSVSVALKRACDRARIAGVVTLPAIEVGGSLLSGDDAVEQAAALIPVAELRET